MCAWVVFLASPVSQVTDSHYSMLLAQSLVERGSFRLDAPFAGGFDPEIHPGMRGDGPPYQIERVGGHLYYAFPPGSSVLSAPLVALLRPLGLSAVRPDGGYDRRGERHLQRAIAPLLMAAFVALAYASARLLLPQGPSLLIAVGAGLGSPIWSTASRGLWSHTWALLLVGCVVHQLLRRAARGGRVNGFASATLLCWAFFARPTAVVAIAVTALHLLRTERRALPGLALGLAVWLGAFAGWSLWHFGAPLPAYFAAGRLGSGAVLEALAGHLISPSRGLLLFVPQLAVVFGLLWVHRAHWPCRGLAQLSLLAAGAHWTLAASFPHWWGGYAYGPRLMTDAIPWLVVLAIVALRARIDAIRAGVAAPWPAARRLALALLAAAVAIHAGGSLSARAMRWNYVPRSIDAHPERLWDWRDPQLTSWLRTR